MVKLNEAQKEYLRTMLADKAAATITELEASPNTQALMKRLVDTVNTAMSGKSLAGNDPRLQNFETVYKSQRPQPTLADLQQQQKALNARLKALSRVTKGAAEAAETEAIQRVMLLASNLNLSENAVTELIRQYSIGEVTSILQTLSNTKATKGYLIDPFFGTRTTRLTAQDVATYIGQKSKSDGDTFFS